MMVEFIDLPNRLLTAYYGEVYGIGFFKKILNDCKNETDRAKLWNSLLQVEQRTATLLRLELDKMSQSAIVLMEDEMLHYDKGVSLADQWINLDWDSLIATLIKWVEPYEATYRQWALSNKTKHIFQVLADHETALFECLKLEQRNESGLAVLFEFLSKNPLPLQVNDQPMLDIPGMTANIRETKELNDCKMMNYNK